MNERASTSSTNESNDPIIPVNERAATSSANESNGPTIPVNERASTSAVVAQGETDDIACVIASRLSDENKYRMLKNRWQPPKDFKFPASKPRNLKFKEHWMNQYAWLVYSQSNDGAYCNFCVFFTPEEVGGIKPNSLVSQPFNNWKNAKEQFNYHQNLNYHKNATVFAQKFIQVREKKAVAVSVQLDKEKRAQIELNRKILTSIIETLIFIGRQEIACRGHRDAGPVTPEFPEKNDGNFRALLRFRLACGDVILRNHLQISKQYTSPQIQNQIIEICGKVIVDEVVSRVNRAKFFSILADETTDVSGIEQFTVCIRYVDSDNDSAFLREDFLKFIPVTDVTGDGLAQTLMETCQAMKLDFKFLVAQGYDGAAPMSGKFNGCAAKILVKHAQAIYIHCCSHSLNLVVSDSCSIPLIRNCLGTIREIINFFRCSAQRQNCLNVAVNELHNEIKKKRLTRYCETRWLERLDSIIMFKEFFLPIFNALEVIQEHSSNKESSEKAFRYRETIKSGNFIVAMVVIHELFSVTHPLSVSLQGKNVDLASAIDMTDNLYNVFRTMRDNADEKFEQLFNVASELAAEIGETIRAPRTTSRQVHRDNYDVNDPEDYYRLSIFIPFVDHFISHLNERFLKHKNVLQRMFSREFKTYCRNL